jgi:tRNA pseudouridine32 synthase/23S rRNA pseudouridine746 synthase
MPPPASALPERFPHPQGGHAPHPIARQAADALMKELGDTESERGRAAQREREGKMFGVLVVRDRHGQLGYLAGFSGMLDGHWLVDGFVPPLFDLEARDRFWPAGQASLREVAAELDELEARLIPIRAELEQLTESGAAELEVLRARHRHRKAERARQRAVLSTGREAQLRQLAHQSSGDRRERRQLRAAQAAAEAELRERLAALHALTRQVRQRRAELSNQLLTKIFDLYAVIDANQQEHHIATAYSGPPPGGAGDCAAPKLLGYANLHRLEPVALAEFWWGPPPDTGGRHHRLYYPSCRGKCGPLLPVMLNGVEVADPPRFCQDDIAFDQPRVLFEDDWLLVVEKPAGLLSVPGRGPALRDSVEHRLRERYSECSPRPAHRLDLDTSGLMVVGKDGATYSALQELFASREVTKRYIAWLDGEVEEDAGEVELALRLDVDDRPRQIHDPIHGKPAVTRWRVLERRDGRTRVELQPLTGRTHQLRVHASHPRGIGRAIVGDRLYGFSGPRMMLHAESLRLRHPRTGEVLEVESPAPF